ncbi:MAG TPA: hypothetical protein VFQ47_05205 [Nitrososphaera sp.]|nr:hypothetical protein [Nitrososphaera sp.]
MSEITLPHVGGIVITEHDCVEIRYTPTILHILRPCNTQSAGYTSLIVTTSSS